jgi:hypothetical protein
MKNARFKDGTRKIGIPSMNKAENVDGKGFAGQAGE